jgi:predicted metal-dependent hydrolase
MPEIADAVLHYLAVYPEEALAQVCALLGGGELCERLQRRYAQAHAVRTDGAHYDYTKALKTRFMRSVAPVSKVVYDNRLHVVQNALGAHTTVARVQGNKLKAKREIRVVGVFRNAPAEFLKMIVVQELAHLKERAHDKAFYALCTHMAPDYHQLEFDLRLYLAQMELAGSVRLTNLP